MKSDPEQATTSERYCPSCERSFGPEVERCPEDGTSLVRFDRGKDPFLGRDLDGRFTIKERLGAGGMGAVYRALQHSVGREVAIKIINASQIAEPIAAKRFLREAKLTSRLAHPNTVAMLDFGQTHDGVFYLVMELLQGRTLRSVLEKDGPFDPTRLVRVGGQMCDALSVAHGMSIVHRDLKPSNVIVLDEPAGRDLIKVLDFGLAKSLAGDTHSTTVTGSGKALGTPAYMSPEVCRGRESDARGDLYSLGVILYELIRGEQPFTGETPHELLMKHVTEPPPPLDGVPPGIAAVIERLLAKRPDDRYASAAATREALDLALSRIPARPRGKIGGGDHSLADTQPAEAVAEVPAHAIGASTGSAIASIRRRWLVPLAALVLVVAAALVAARWFWPPTHKPVAQIPTPIPTPTPTATNPGSRVADPSPPAPAPAQAAPLARRLDEGGIRGLASVSAPTAPAAGRAQDRDRDKPRDRPPAAATTTQPPPDQNPVPPNSQPPPVPYPF